MKKKGFTLIELLAVIVVLAIIALIATPIVMNTIEKSKKGAAERSADNYIDAVEIAAATSKLDGNDILDGEYTIDEDGNLLVPSLPSGKLTVEMNGNKPSDGTITIKDGQVTTDTTMTIGDYDVAYNEDNKKYEATKKIMEVLCTKKDGVDLANLTYGNEFTCELGDNASKTFYVLETNGDKVSLIMNANIDSNGKAITSSDATDKGLVAWSEDGSNYKDEDATKQAVTAKAYLSSSTASWTKLKQSQINLPSASQIATAAGTTLDGLNTDSVMITTATWLYNYLMGTSNPVSDVGGYWTSSPHSADSTSAIGVNFYGGIYYGSADLSIYDGVRPVITISKANLS